MLVTTGSTSIWFRLVLSGSALVCLHLVGNSLSESATLSVCICLLLPESAIVCCLSAICLSESVVVCLFYSRLTFYLCDSVLCTGKRVAYPVVANYVFWVKGFLENVSTVPLWVKLHGLPVTAFSEDGLSAIATKLGAGEKKTVKKPSQTSRGVPVGPKMGFKPHKEYRPVTKKPNASSSGN
nr:hypothetical protein [Tanacetum cinerariifolium]